MRLFMAGGVSGNLNPVWKMVAKGKGWDEAIESFLGRSRESALDPVPDG